MPFYTVSKGITRIEPDSGQRIGFMVRICREGKKINEFFSDKVFGSKRKALVAAEARYAKLLEEYGPANIHTTRDVLTDRNTTGYVGVHIAKSVDTIWSNNEYFAYCASWVDDDGKRKKIAFSIEKHGKKPALELAVLARKKRLTDRAKVLALYEKQSGAFKGKLKKVSEKLASQGANKKGSDQPSPKAATEKSSTKLASKSPTKKTTVAKAAVKKTAAKKATSKKAPAKKSTKKTSKKK